MIIRKPRISDYKFVVECYDPANWPLTESVGVVTVDTFMTWLHHWQHEHQFHEGDVVCWVGETDQADVDAGRAEQTGIPVGLELYYMDPDDESIVHIHNVVVHPDHQKKGFSRLIRDACWDHIPASVTKAVYKTLQGSAIEADAKEGKHRQEGKYETTGTEESETGTLVTGQVMRNTRQSK